MSRVKWDSSRIRQFRFINRMQFTKSRFGLTMYLNSDSLIEYPLWFRRVMKSDNFENIDYGSSLK